MSSVNNQLKEFFSSNLKSDRKIVVSSKGTSKRLHLQSYLSSKDQLFDCVEPNPNLTQLTDFLHTVKLDSETTVVAIGGGSVIDFSKLVCLFFNTNVDDIGIQIESGAYRNIHSALKLVVIPTLYGSGAEQTPFAVCYIGNKKYSVSSPSLLPKTIYYVSAFSETIPIPVKEENILDCFCQASESLTSVNANELSKSYAVRAINLLVEHALDYVALNKHVKEIMKASEYCGKAIAISKTTGPHALSYHLTSIHALPHGRAVALCFLYFLQFYSSPKYKDLNQLIDFFEQLSISFDCGVDELTVVIPKFFDNLGLNANGIKKTISSRLDYEDWFSSVNLERLINGPQISEEDFNEATLKLFIDN